MLDLSVLVGSLDYEFGEYVILPEKGPIPVVVLVVAGGLALSLLFALISFFFSYCNTKKAFFVRVACVIFFGSLALLIGAVISGPPSWNERVSLLFGEEVSVKAIRETELSFRVDEGLVESIPVTLVDGSEAVLEVDGYAAKLSKGEELVEADETSHLTDVLSSLNEDEKQELREMLDNG